MNSYRYRITVDALTDMRGQPVSGKSLSFETPNHDDLFTIVDRIRALGDFDPDNAAALAIGLKLFTEVMLMHRNNPLFEPIREPMREFIKSLKARNAPSPQRPA